MGEENSSMDIISLKGRRDLWQDFVHKVKKNRQQVWDVIEPMLKDYIKNK